MRRSKTAAPTQGQRSKIDLLNDSWSSTRSNHGNSSVNASWDLSSPVRKPQAFGRRSLQDALLSGSNNNKNVDVNHDHDCKQQQQTPRSSSCLLEKNGSEIEELLKLLRTTEFVGEVDKEHHLQYMKEPSVAPKSPPKATKKIMMRSSFQSDTHLLNMKATANASMVPAWAQ